MQMSGRGYVRTLIKAPEMKPPQVRHVLTALFGSCFMISLDK